MDPRLSFAPMFLQILFWILFILWSVSCFAPVPAPYDRGFKVVLIILVGILGYVAFGNPVHR